ncbi:hypothetical protein SLEP1_g12172 [Rubroshorea leprosula]|uniref:Uncharacterized protein n=1 Tax=Rubroshorea leprosula TaxID=152421 RepID=A0AAV5IHH5_9ROSI|nr:hypothetical protein SLEP1_g12172 [Rubroshorea leprosula]
MSTIDHTTTFIPLPFSRPAYVRMIQLSKHGSIDFTYLEMSTG